MSLLLERVDKRINVIFICVAVLVAITLYILYDVKYGRIGQIVSNLLNTHREIADKLKRMEVAPRPTAIEQPVTRQAASRPLDYTPLSHLQNFQVDDSRRDHSTYTDSDDDFNYQVV